MARRRSLFGTVLRDFVSLFFPDYCLGCSNTLVKGEKMICTRCMLEMPQTLYHVRAENPLRNRLAGRIPIVHALAFFRFSKRGRIQHILHALKYRNEPEAGVILGRVYGQRLREASFAFDLIVPVPLHESRLRKRGYNQSAKFAEGLAESLGAPVCENLLRRTVRTQTQTNKSKLRRWENVSEVFSISSGPDIRNKHILLVDDVITTGATIEACAMVLCRVEGCRVSIGSIAVA